MEGQNLTLLFLENDSQRIEQVEQLLLKAHFSLVLHVVKNEGDLLEAASLLPLQLILINSSLLSSPQQLKLLALFKKAPILFLSHPEEEENVFRLLSQGLDDCVFLDESSL